MFWVKCFKFALLYSFRLLLVCLSGTFLVVQANNVVLGVVSATFKHIIVILVRRTFSIWLLKCFFFNFFKLKNNDPIVSILFGTSFAIVQLHHLQCFVCSNLFTLLLLIAAFKLQTKNNGLFN